AFGRSVQHAAAPDAQACDLQPDGRLVADDGRSEASALDLLERAGSVRVLHPAQDVLDSVLWYGLPVDGALVAITSTRHAHRGDQLPEEIALRHGDPGPSTVSRELAVRWLTIGESGSIARTLDAGPPRW